jgi:hypothetical protein
MLPPIDDMTRMTSVVVSWLNQVEIEFNQITQQALRRGTFRGVKENCGEDRYRPAVLQRQRTPFRLDRDSRFDLHQSATTM